MDSNTQLQELQKELETKLGSLEKLMKGYRLKLYWYLGILTLSTLGTLTYQVTATWQIHKIGSLFQEKIQSVDKRVDAILSKVEEIKKLDPSLLLRGGGEKGAMDSGSLSAIENLIKDKKSKDGK
jgi:hypothetical protein